MKTLYGLGNYIDSIREWTQENENKNPIFYYFPISSEELKENKRLVKWGFEHDLNPISLLWMIMDNKRK